MASKNKSGVYVIAEAGVNHNGNIKKAIELIDISKKAGADCVKFQIFDSTKLSTPLNKLAPYQKLNTKFSTQSDMLKKYQLNESNITKLYNYAKKIKIDFLCSPFDIDSIKLLISIGLKKIKIPSGEITNFPYLTVLGKYNCDLILSSGMSNLEEIKNAIEILTTNGTKKNKITILHCTSDYPAKFNELNLNVIKTLKTKLDLNIGYSDHSVGYEASCAAVTLGASMIEKHITLNNFMRGPDHKASLNFRNFKIFVQKIRNVENALGSNHKKITNSERLNIKYVRKSIVAKKNIFKGEIFSEKNLDVKRPGTGLSPMLWNKIIGQKAKKNFLKNQLIKL